MKKKFKNIVLIVMAVALSGLVDLMSAGISYAQTKPESPIDFENLKERLEKATEVRHSTRILYECLKANNDLDKQGWALGNDMDNPFKYSHEQASGELSNQFGLFDTNMQLGLFNRALMGINIPGTFGVGRWLEYKVQQGSSNGDGAIDCGDGSDNLHLDGIIDLVAEKLEITRDDLICGKNNTPGLLKNFDNNGCNIDSYDQYFAPNTGENGSYPDAIEYLENIYTEWLDNFFEEKDYDLKSYFSWGRVIDPYYNGLDGYYLYTFDLDGRELSTGSLCGGTLSADDDISLSSLQDIPLKSVDEFGNEVYVYYKGSANNGKENVIAENSFVYKEENKDGWTCRDYIEAANALFPTVQAAIQDKIRQSCYTKRLEQISTIDESTASEETKAGIAKVRSLQQEYEASNATSQDGENAHSGVFTQPYEDEDGNPGNGGLTCLHIDGLEDIGVEDYVAPENVVEASCIDAGGAGALGWVVCPIFDWFKNTSKEIYTEFLEPSLQVDPTLFTEGTDDGTYEAWGVFRDFSNLCFIILLMVVIFSQVTGWGIDNYGVKKILPKLVVVAVLVNLSYILCTICVDLSNIVGNGIQRIFENIQPTTSSLIMDGTAVTVDDNIWPGVGILTAGALATVAVLANPAMLLSLFVSAIGLMISIFFLFVLLAARQAAVIILTVVAPVAIVCYALPNTKSVFDKWLKLGMGLLMVYPIVGLLVGGGEFVSRLLMVSGFASTGFPAALTAMLVCIVPIFFIPSVLKSAFAAMGNIGAKISGLGAQMSGMATNKIRSTDTYQNLQKMGKDRQKRIMSGTNKDGSLNILGKIKSRVANSKFGRATGYQATYAGNVASVQRNMAMNREAETMLAERQLENLTEDQIHDKWDQAFNSGNTNSLDAITNVMNKRFGTSSTSNYIAGFLADKDVANDPVAQRSLLALRSNINNNSNFSSDMRNKASDAFFMISTGGLGKDAEGNVVHQNLPYFSKNNPIPKDDESWSNQSGETIKRAVDAGKLDQARLQSILNSDNRTVKNNLTDNSRLEAIQGGLYKLQHSGEENINNMSYKDAAKLYAAENSTQNGRNARDQHYERLMKTRDNNRRQRS